MLIQSFLVQGAAAATTIASRLASLSSPSLDALVLFSLGVDHSSLVDAVRDYQQQKKCTCPVYLSETYGILGFDDDLGKNIELMEKGRGSEYGFVGGSGGQGCLVVGFSEGAVAGHDISQLPTTDHAASSCLIVADQSGAWAKVQSKAPLQYGGITKECWKIRDDGRLEPVPYFFVADVSGEPVGVSTFTDDDDAEAATASLLKKMSADRKASGAIGLFPCFTRGVNCYNGRENVESEAITRVVPNARVFGMFAHGELGPQSFAGFTAEANQIPCKQHSMTSILSIHTTTAVLEE